MTYCLTMSYTLYLSNRLAGAKVDCNTSAFAYKTNTKCNYLFSLLLTKGKSCVRIRHIFSMIALIKTGTRWRQTHLSQIDTNVPMTYSEKVTSCINIHCIAQLSIFQNGDIEINTTLTNIEKTHILIIFLKFFRKKMSCLLWLLK